MYFYRRPVSVDQNRVNAAYKNVTVAKFGGSSLSDSKQFEKVKNIISLDDRRSCIVISAPGKRHSEDTKVTDLLIQLYELNKKIYKQEVCFE